MKNLPLLLLLALLASGACRNKTNPTPQLASGKAFVMLPDSVIKAFAERPVPPWAPKKFSFRPSAERRWNLGHTCLRVSFNWETETMPAQAELQMAPYFYPQDSLILDGKGFDIDSVHVLCGREELTGGYSYDGRKIRIGLRRMVNRNETIRVNIAYTAQPNSVPAGGSAAITSDKGLYFINPRGKETGKMPQIWTQGETEAASVWFPTFDSPNTKTTQEIFLTVDNRYTTLSNGKLVSSKKNRDGTRTDHWKQDLPHAPYLFMMGVGEFRVVKDTWTRADGTRMEVNYYVEPPYEKDARAIFGKTPEMIRFFSEKLGVEYPWDKYSQIVVRDFVSGAMENTGAVVFGDFVYKSRRELTDANDESTIAHELFHHWFGDLVTCESWANLPLNESFANYSQFLWDEYKYGTDEAEWNAEKEKQQYLYESSRKREPMIRYYHNQPDDMFDGHSYAKGGRLLHMLRKETGDAAFFESLKLYLTRHAYGSAEIHDLRQAFETITGKDLMPFFEQWFMKAGHPELRIGVIPDENNRGILIRVRQAQDTVYSPLYRLSVPVEVWSRTGCKTRILDIRSASDTFFIPLDAPAEAVIWDAGASVLAETEIYMKPELWAAQFRLAGRAIHRYQALNWLRQNEPDNRLTLEVMDRGLTDSFWAIRQGCLEVLEDKDEDLKTARLEILKKMALQDASPAVRTAALKVLGPMTFDGKKELMARALDDSSLNVSAMAFRIYLREDYPDAREKTSRLEESGESGYSGVLAEFYAGQGGEAAFSWFEKNLRKPGMSQGYELLQSLGRMLKASQDSALVKRGLALIFEISKGKARPEIVVGGFQVLKYFQEWPGVTEMRKTIRQNHTEGELAEILEYLD